MIPSIRMIWNYLKNNLFNLLSKSNKIEVEENLQNHQIQEKKSHRLQVNYLFI